MRRAYTNNIHTIAGTFGIEAAAVAIIKVSLYLVMLCFKVSWLVIVVYIVIMLMCVPHSVNVVLVYYLSSLKT